MSFIHADIHPQNRMFHRIWARTVNMVIRMIHHTNHWRMMAMNIIVIEEFIIIQSDYKWLDKYCNHNVKLLPLNKICWLFAKHLHSVLKNNKNFCFLGVKSVYLTRLDWTTTIYIYFYELVASLYRRLKTICWYFFFPLNKTIFCSAILWADLLTRINFIH